MTMAAQFNPAPAVYRHGTSSDSRGLLDLSRSKLMEIRGSGAVLRGLTAPRVEVGPKHSGTVTQSIQQQGSYDEKLFDCLVSMKVAVSYYAMHLTAEERHRIFNRLDAVINSEDWHEEDPLPHLESFHNFLKWMIHSKDFSWSSIGVSNEGTILIAWSRPNLALTANFANESKVTWTAAVETNEGPVHAVGTGPLRYFTKEALFYLRG